MKHTGFSLLQRLPALIFDIPVCSFSLRVSESERQVIAGVLEAGDILLTADRLFPLWRLWSAVLGSPLYSHAAVYAGDNRVVEATTFHPSGMGVAYTPLHDFLSGRKDIRVVRPAYRSKHDRRAVLEWLGWQVGKPYDYGFNGSGEQAMYCSKLVAAAMHRAGLPVRTRCILRNNIYLPDVFMRMPGAETMYCTHGKERKSQLYCLPIALSVVALPAFPVAGAALCAGLVAAGLLQYLKLM